MALVPLPVALPLMAAALLLGFSKKLPGRVVDLLSIGTALASAILCAILAGQVGSGPVTYWFGGWSTIGPQVVGISFVVDLASASVGAFVGLLFAATLVFSWRFFEDVHGHFHVLMLVFMAGMIGFCLAGDLFNMFVWFELMSVAGFAATAYALRDSAIAGALNFTVVNSVGAYVFLAGIALLYGQTGVLDMAAIGRGVAVHPGDPVVVLGFVLIATALLTKAAQVPFQMWLGDAHAVAPSPVSVIFSGAMVGMGLFGLAKLVFHVFAGSPLVLQGMQAVMLPMGLVSAVVGGLMALRQRHIKRLLAFSTISHAGIMLTGLSLVSTDGASGLLAYLVGHGMVKGAMFMLAGFLAARLGGIDEIQLIGRGRSHWPVGLLMAAGGVLLAGLPVGPMDEGFAFIVHAAAATGRDWIEVPLFVAAACTGAAVLRVSGRVFAGWGEMPGDEEEGETEDEEEPEKRSLWLLVGPAALMLAVAVIGWDADGTFAHRAGLALTGLPAPAPSHLGGEAAPWFAVAAAILLAAFDLSRRHLPHALVAAMDAVRGPPTRVLQYMQSGLVTDYVAWLAVGLATISVAFLLWL